MPAFSDFTQLLRGGVKASGVSVDKLIKVQSATAMNEEGMSEQLKDIAQMFSNIMDKVSSEQETLSGKDLMKELSSIDNRFVQYFDNLSDLRIYLQRFTDPNYEMNRDESMRLHDLLKSNKSIVSQINEQKNNDKVYNDKLEQVQRNTGFIFRSRGIAEDEQRKVESKHNLKTDELWENINKNIGSLSTDVMADLKTSLIDGIGGPYVQMTRETLVPLLAKLGQSKLGKFLGDKIGSFSNSVKGLFVKDGEKREQVEREIAKEQADQTGTEFETVAEDMVVPSQSDVRKKTIREERARAPFDTKRSEKGIFRKLYEESQKTNVLLKDIILQLRDEHEQLDESYEKLAEISLVSEAMSDTSSNNMELLKNIGDSQIKADEYLSDILKEDKVANRKSDLIEEFNQEVFDRNSETMEDEADYREFDTYMTDKIYKKLDDIEDGLGGIEGDGGLGAGAGGLMASITPILGTIAAVLGIIAAVAGVAFAAFKIGKKGQERREKEHKFLTGEREKLAQQISGTEEGSKLQESLLKESKEEEKLGMGIEEALRRAPELMIPLAGTPQEEIDRVMAERERLQSVIDERRKAEAEALREKLTKEGLTVGMTEEGKQVFDIQDILKEGVIGTKKDIFELAQQGDFAIRAGTEKTGIFGGGKETERIVEPTKGQQFLDFFKLGGLESYERQTGENIDEILKNRLRENIGQEGDIQEVINDLKEKMKEFGVGGGGTEDVNVEAPESKTVKAPEGIASIDLNKNIESARADIDKTEMEIEKARQIAMVPQPIQQQLPTGEEAGGKVSDKRKGLEGVSILPEDNFGLIMVNSGTVLT